MDHRTIKKFDTQKDLSHCQAQWMEFLSQYTYNIHYVKGEDNSVANVLSQLPIKETDDEEGPIQIASVFLISSDADLIAEIKRGYKEDLFCNKILNDIRAKMIEPSSGIEIKNGLLYLGSRLAIPRTSDLCESLFCLAHDSLGHFGRDKSYASLQNDFYWLNMRKDLVKSYVPSCSDCQ
jgi:hypothetical protein